MTKLLTRPSDNVPKTNNFEKGIYQKVELFTNNIQRNIKLADLRLYLTSVSLLHGSQWCELIVLFSLVKQADLGNLNEGPYKQHLCKIILKLHQLFTCFITRSCVWQ